MRVTEEVAMGLQDEPVHVPVLLAEVLELLAPVLEAHPEGWIVDGTLGAAGHASALLKAHPRARLLGIDQDPAILGLARQRLEPFGERALCLPGRLSTLAKLLERELDAAPVAMLFDLGASSLQLDTADRGFSFVQDGPLDMRMDPERQRSAADIVNGWDEADLADLFYYEGDERHSRAIARAIVQARRRAPFLRTAALADVIARASGRHGGRIHPATRCFQALRRAVNEEGDELIAGLRAARAGLESGGVLAVIAFHSGEDRTVKRFFAEREPGCAWKSLTPKPRTAGAGEVRRNRRARSAKLRVARLERGQAGGRP